MAKEAEISQRDGGMMIADWTVMTLPHCSIMARDRKRRRKVLYQFSISDLQK